MSYLSIFALLIFFLFIFTSLNYNNININLQNVSINYSKCLRFMDSNWDIFETRYGSLTDDMIRKRLFPLIKEMTKELKKNQCIYDIGGNIGDITKMFNEFYPNSFVFTVEPVNINYRELKKRFNNCENIKLYNYAIGSFNGEKASHTFGNGGVGDYLYPGRLLSEFDVKYITLDKFYKDFSIIYNYYYR